MMAHVDLCSGIGGFALGFEWAGLSKPVLFCDIEPWSRKVLSKHWPDVPIAEDVKELASDPARLVPDCDILTAGYPCQPFSVAGKQRGAEDDRHIWPEIFTIVQAKRPNWCVFENVSGHISLGLDQVLSDLEDKAGYAVQTFCVGAVSVNAPHRRQRIWIIADTDSAGCKEQWGGQPAQAQYEAAQRRDWWFVEPPVGRVAHGISGRMDRFDGWEREPEDIPRVATGVKDRVSRLRGLGNAIVPQIAMQIGLTIKAVHDD